MELTQEILPRLKLHGKYEYDDLIRELDAAKLTIEATFRRLDDIYLKIDDLPPIPEVDLSGYYTKVESDARYYTEAEIDAAFVALSEMMAATYAPIAHNHDSRYYTETESDARYALVGHNHDLTYAAINHNHDSRYPRYDAAAPLTTPQKAQFASNVGMAGIWERIPFTSNYSNVASVDLTSLSAFNEVRVKGLLSVIGSGVSVGWRISSAGVWRTAAQYERDAGYMYGTGAMSSVKDLYDIGYMNTYSAVNTATYYPFTLEFRGFNDASVRTQMFTQMRFYGDVGVWVYCWGTIGHQAFEVNDGIRLYAIGSNINVRSLVVEGLRG